MPAEGEEMRNPDAVSRNDAAQMAAGLLDRLRTRTPRVHCITNAVAQNFTANMLLATGCVPSMTLSPEEIAPFVVRSSALLVNLGTFDRERREATKIAVETARQGNVPWLLDPVFVDQAPQRLAFARQLIVLGPTAVRLNHDEFSALTGSEPAHAAVATYALDRKTVVGLSGESDLVTDGSRMATIDSGHPLMAKVTAMGCAASALMAACLGVEPDTFRAATAALVMIGVAGELAAREAKGPGSFAVAIIDTLHNLDASTLIKFAKVS